jgi:hypothetical protein
MTESSLLWVLGGLQTVNLLLLGWIKMDIKELWKRANSHGHKIECTEKDCRPRTMGVLINE